MFQKIVLYNIVNKKEMKNKKALNKKTKKQKKKTHQVILLDEFLFL